MCAFQTIISPVVVELDYVWWGQEDLRIRERYLLVAESIQRILPRQSRVYMLHCVVVGVRTIALALDSS